MRISLLAAASTILALVACAAPPSGDEGETAGAYTTGASEASEIELGQFVSADGKAVLYLGKQDSTWQQVSVELAVHRRQDTASVRGNLDLERRNPKKGKIEGAESVTLEQVGPGRVRVRGSFDHDTITLDEELTIRDDVFVGAFKGDRDVLVEVSASDGKGVTATISQNGETLSTGTHAWKGSMMTDVFELAPGCRGWLSVSKKKGELGARLAYYTATAGCDRFWR
jgi:hypothetical protein